MTTTSLEEREGAFRPTEPEPRQPDTDALEIAPSAPQQSWLQITEDFGILNDQKSSEADDGAGSGPNQQVLGIQYGDTQDPEFSSPVIAENDVEETSFTCIDTIIVECWEDSQHYYQGATENEISKIRTRIWKLSTPPALFLIGHQRSQKAAASTRARETIRSNVSISWTHGPTSWTDDHFLNEDPSLGAPDPSSRSTGIEISFAEMTWSEICFRESRRLKAYRSYKPTLLRWCWTATDGRG
jgi:hypothetical protein